MGLINNYRQEINTEIALKLMPCLKEDYLEDRPCKWDESTIELWKIASALTGDCDPSIEKHSILCTPIFFDKHGYQFRSTHKQTAREQIVIFDDQIGAIHEICEYCGYGYIDKNIWLIRINAEINHG